MRSFLQPFITLQLGGGWFVRSQPQMIFDWTSRKQLLLWNASTAGPAPLYGFTFGMSFLYPDFWRGLLGGATTGTEAAPQAGGRS